MPSAPIDAEAWETFAAGAPDADPEASVTAQYAATVKAEPPVPVTPEVTLPELPLVVVDRLHGVHPGGHPGGGAAPGGGDAEFEVTGVLGEGGMGRVLLARQRSLRRDVAIKVIKALHPDAAGVDTLLAEALVTGSVEHPGVIPVHALGRDADGHPLLVMKRVEGVSWRELARDPDHPLWAVIAPDAGDRLDAHLEILLAVCSAVHCAHARGFVHRDIKLDNVMIGSFGEVYLVDWGIAVRAAAAGWPSRGRPGLCGTPSHMAPEMVRGDLDRMDARTDVYLLGATLHALLTGASRHRGPSIVEVLISARRSEPFDYGAGVPAELAAVCNRATAASPADRFASALDFRLAVAAFRRHRGSIALSDQASAQLARVPVSAEHGLDGGRVHAALTECRFGFTAALRAWPENAGAAVGLTRCLVRMIDHEILQRDAEGARALLAELAGEHPDVARRIEALEAELRAAAGRDAELARLSRERDLSVGGGAQLAVVGLLPVLGLGVFLYMKRRGDGPYQAAELIGVPAATVLILLSAAWISRRRLDTEISRKAVAMLVLVITAVTAHRALMVAFGAPLAQTLAGDLLLAAAVLAGLAVTLMPRVGWVVPVPLAGTVCLALRPDVPVPVFATTALCGLTLVLVAWRRSVRG